MNDRITRHYNTFTNIVAYGAKNSAEYGPKSAVPGYYTELKGIVDQMDKAKAGQLAGSGADATDGLLTALKEDLQLIGGIARENDDAQPGLKDKFPTVGTTEQSILTTTDAYLKQLEIQPTDDAATQTAKTNLATLFIAHEMPETFVEDLRADRDAVKPAGDQAAGVSNEKVENTAALSLLSNQGMKLRGKVRAALRAKYARQPDKLAAAMSATHVERAPQRASNGAAAKTTDSQSAAATGSGNASTTTPAK